ncbi:hypothetical protein GCM10027406_30860 [Leifsonia lichenia]
MKHGGVTLAVVVSVLLGATLSGCTSGSPTPSTAHSPETSTFATLTCPAAPAARTSALGGSATDRLVPFTPTGLLVCHYAPGPAKLEERIANDPAKAANVAKELNALRQSAEGLLSCPADSGEEADLYFWDASARATVTVGLSGCTVAANGNVARFADVGPVFRRSLGLPAQPDPFYTTG